MQEKILEEEQLDLLGKMLLYSLDHMSGRDREVYDALVESISQRANRLRKLEKQTGLHHRQTVPLDSESSSTEHARERSAKYRAVKNKSPVEIVRTFIESWNYQDFETEYFCLSSSFKKGGRSTMEVDEYVRTRQMKYHSGGYAAPLKKTVESISSPETRGNRSIVECFEIHDEFNERVHLLREYTMIFEDKGWRILDFVTKRKSYDKINPA